MTDSFASPLLAWLLTYGIHSTVLLGAVWLVTKKFQLSHSWTETLWKTAISGGILTATWQGSFLGEPVSGNLGSLPTTKQAPVTLPTSIPLPEAAREVRYLNAPEPGFEVAEESRVASSSTSWQPWVAGIWMATATTILGLFFLAKFRFHSHLRNRTEVGKGPLLVNFLKVCSDTGIRRAIKLTVVPGLNSSVALGRSEVCIPERAVKELTTEQQQAMFAHELAHLVRLDPFWLTLLASLERIFFFQPLNRLAARRLRENSEYLCDAWAVRKTGKSTDLAHCLTEVASWMQRSPESEIVPGMATQKSIFLQRIQFLLQGGSTMDKKHLVAQIPLVFCLLTSVACFVPGVRVEEPRQEVGQEEPSSPTEIAEASLQEKAGILERMGLVLKRPSKELADHFELSRDFLLVSEVQEGMLGQKLGLKPNDLILSMGDSSKPSLESFRDMIQNHRGKKYEFTVVRQGKTRKWECLVPGEPLPPTPEMIILRRLQGDLEGLESNLAQLQGEEKKTLEAQISALRKNIESLDLLIQSRQAGMYSWDQGKPPQKPEETTKLLQLGDFLVNAAESDQSAYVRAKINVIVESSLDSGEIARRFNEESVLGSIIRDRITLIMRNKRREEFDGDLAVRILKREVAKVIQKIAFPENQGLVVEVNFRELVVE